MDISSRFSLVDFLAYFFPGVVGTIGIYLILLPTPLGSGLIDLDIDLALGVVFFIFSYVVGVILSGISEVFIKRSRKPETFGKSLLLVPGYEKEVVKAFRDLFPRKEEGRPGWSLSNFYLCRSLVIENMPNLAEMIHRQSSLRQLRMNLLPVVLIWFAAGLIWGAAWIQENRVLGGILLIVISAILSVLFIVTLIDRMKSNENREVREVLTAFLAGYKTGMFERQGGKKEGEHQGGL